MNLDGAHSLPTADTLPSLASGIKLVPICGSDGNMVRVCAVLKRVSERWELSHLGSPTGGRIYLGVLVDHDGQIKEWLELWVQSVAGLEGTIRMSGLEYNNGTLDARWHKMVDSIRTSAPGTFFSTGFEKENAPPSWIDVEKGCMVTPAVESGEIAELCKNDTILIQVGLSPYSISGRRYLWIKNQPEKGFFPVSPFPLSSNTELPEWSRRIEKLLPFNPEGGLMLVRQRAAFNLSDYINLLSGHSIATKSAEDIIFANQQLPRRLNYEVIQQKNDSCLLPTTQGKSGRFLETFFHKLHLFSELINVVREVVSIQQLPLLNITTSSFRINLSSPQGKAPLLWSSQISLAKPSCAIELPFSLGHRRLFQPIKTAQFTAITGDVCIQRVICNEANNPCIECVLTGASLPPISKTDIVWLELPMPGSGRLDVFGKLDATAPARSEEYRVISAPLAHALDEASAAWLHAGKVLANVPMGTFPFMSTSSDLHALGVLGVQIFLSPSADGVPQALDAIMRFADDLNTADSSLSLGKKAALLAARNPLWHQVLGPHHHGHDCTSPDEAYEWIPAELWWDTVATLTRFFHGATPNSFLKNLEDVPDDIAKIFDGPYCALNRLARSTQSLLFSDWKSSREISKVIQRIR